EVVSRDRVHLGLPDRLGKQQLLTLGGCDLGRLAAHLGCELELAAALEGAEAAAEVELDAVVVAEAGFDVGAAQGVTAAGALTTPDLGPEHPEDDLFHLGVEVKSRLKHSCYGLLRNLR